jgi:hypothetical protein
MKTRKIKLTLFQKFRLRRSARKLYAQCYRDGGTRERTEQLFRDRAPEKLGVDPFTILLLLRIFLALLEYWFNTRHISPKDEVEPSEPPLNWNMEIVVGDVSE